MRTNKATLDTIRKAFDMMVYENELDCAVRKARRVLASVGCRVEKVGPYVHLDSPLTGSHTLNMAYGVRPVSDLMVHVEGFAEVQRQRRHDAPELSWTGDTGKVDARTQPHGAAIQRLLDTL